ncbi:MAG: response regulator transcription factor [Chlorobi bacterium]|nr:response regulator transcription factor [Chlorobiota bacterium]
MIEILMADDHILIREGLKKILDYEIDINVKADVKCAAEIFDFLKEDTCDVLILDINLPDMNGLDVLKQAKILYPNLKILILSMYPEDRFAIRALRAGAMGYLTKDSASDELVSAIRKVNSGRKYINENVAQQLAFSIGNDSDKKPHEKLSSREFQVLCMIGQGVSVHNIADKLKLSVSTINTYRLRILEKMKLKGNSELIHYAVQNGLTD